MEPSEEIVDVLRSLFVMGNSGDEALLDAMLPSDDDEIVFIGSDPREWYLDTGHVRRLFRAQWAAGVRARFDDILGYRDGNFGWAAGSGVFIWRDGVEVPVRMTTIYRLEDSGRWRLLHLHASHAVDNPSRLGSDASRTSTFPGYRR